MNTLGYILLCMLVRKPCTGYELTQYLKLFWQAHHSQIYTLLGKLEKAGYVTFEEDNLSSPPKKIYSLTALGATTVEDWIHTETPDPINRDEFLGKIYVISMVQPETAAALFKQRRIHYQKTLERNQVKAREVEELQRDPSKQSEFKSSFGRYLITKRREKMCLEELAWCDWAEELYHDYFS